MDERQVLASHHRVMSLPDFDPALGERIDLRLQIAITDLPIEINQRRFFGVAPGRNSQIYINARLWLRQR